MDILGYNIHVLNFLVDWPDLGIKQEKVIGTVRTILYGNLRN